jgi:monoamine oxidase
MQFNPLPDVAIIGAGAAGLAAAIALNREGASVLMLEGRDRIGGRALTRKLEGDLTFDVGCEWLHSADQNLFVPMARSLGFAIVESPPHWAEDSFDIHFPITQQHEFYTEFAAFESRVELAAELSNDTTAAEWLQSGNPWNQLIDAVSTYVNGAELSRVSVWDSGNYVDSHLNWRVRAGYGAMISAIGASCDVALGTEVRKIDHSGRDIRLVTSRGNIRARRVICTVPTTMIAEGLVQFSPALPDKVAAAAGLPLGNAEKVMLAVDEPGIFPEEAHLFGATDRVATGSYDLRPFGQACIEAFFGGKLARELAATEELAAFAVEELVGLMGSDFRCKVHPVAASAWTKDRFCRGSYSHALPGYSQCRAILAEPVDDRLFFAGEATSTSFFSTAHGAYESGIRAAAEVARTLGVSSRVPLGASAS